MRLGLAIWLAALGLSVAAGCTDTQEHGESVAQTETFAGLETEPEPVVPPEQTDSPAATPGRAFLVTRVIDGDTIELRNGQRVRLVQIDAPEPVEGECYSRKSSRVLRALLPEGTRVTLQADPKLDRRDQYDRLLRYVFLDGKNLNIELVKKGAASVWFFEAENGRYAAKLIRAAERAKAAQRGLWGACPGTKLDPLHALQTRGAQATPEPAPEPEPRSAPVRDGGQGEGCHSSYEGACLDQSLSDYDCEGGEGNGPGYTGTVLVVGPDEYELDQDRDGVGCD